MTKSSRIKKGLKEQYRSKDKEAKKSMRKDKRMWTEDLATQAEKAAGNGRMKEVYGKTKSLSNGKTTTS